MFNPTFGVSGLDLGAFGCDLPITAKAGQGLGHRRAIVGIKMHGSLGGQGDPKRDRYAIVGSRKEKPCWLMPASTVPTGVFLAAFAVGGIGPGVISGAGGFDTAPISFQVLQVQVDQPVRCLQPRSFQRLEDVSDDPSSRRHRKEVSDTV